MKTYNILQAQDFAQLQNQMNTHGGQLEGGIMILTMQSQASKKFSVSQQPELITVFVAVMSYPATKQVN